ncbi:hypothetical protein CRG98_045394 [Punica granatum]|uniref:Uncharacterized protein n=1 Tax=Punica granatum TaxID=22663 RepID=A0A2I0HR77_PUNGR|nr:hypothetical protein CRG98_045394 [Punica granatum]
MPNHMSMIMVESLIVLATLAPVVVAPMIVLATTTFNPTLAIILLNPFISELDLKEIGLNINNTGTGSLNESVMEGCPNGFGNREIMYSFKKVEKRARGSQGGSRGRGLEVVGLRSQGRAGVEVVRPSRGQDRLRLRSRTEVMSLRLWLERGLESRVAVAGPRSQGRAGVEVERNGIRIQDHGAVEASSDSDSSGGFV